MRRAAGPAVAMAIAVAALGCGGAPTVTGPSTASTGGGDRTGTPQVRLEKLGSFDQPVYVTQAPGDDHLYIVEQCGRIVRVGLDGSSPTTFLDLTGQVTCGGEQGLLSVAFAPDYAQSGLFYVNYTATDANSHTVAYSRDSGDPSRADPASARELLVIQDFAPNHNGGLLMFGPDGTLYLGMGDGGGEGDPQRTAQNPDVPLGKLLRLDPDRPGQFGVAALGLRNPWRYSFDPKTGDLWIGDVGQNALEEIDAITERRLQAQPPPNFGWSAFEGTDRFNADQQAPGAIPPVFDYGHDQGCSVTGGYVVRDRSLGPLYGRYLYGDFCQGELRSFAGAPGERARDDRALGLHVDQLSSFGTDGAGHVYAVSLSGPVYRLVARG